jgi:hypothetical protein
MFGFNLLFKGKTSVSSMEYYINYLHGKSANTESEKF